MYPVWNKNKQKEVLQTDSLEIEMLSDQNFFLVSFWERGFRRGLVPEYKGSRADMLKSAPWKKPSHRVIIYLGFCATHSGAPGLLLVHCSLFGDHFKDFEGSIQC